jgi:hypothetical protein
MVYQAQGYAVAHCSACPCLAVAAYASELLSDTRLLSDNGEEPRGAPPLIRLISGGEDRTKPKHASSVTRQTD